MTVIHCPKCGKKHIAVDRYCQYCGKDLENIILMLKRKSLPLRFQSKPKPQNRRKIFQNEKKVSEYTETEKKLEKFDVLPENLNSQNLSNFPLIESMVSSLGPPSTKKQKMKLKRKKDPWWEDLMFCCPF
ncbi:MAG: zinc ribbon domain-containing protein [Asgard group archaeon]|nr:zinc ribbon domain-containing protein [Asgard group archaeon]